MIPALESNVRRCEEINTHRPPRLTQQRVQRRAQCTSNPSYVRPVSTPSCALIQILPFGPGLLVPIQIPTPHYQSHLFYPPDLLPAKVKQRHPLPRTPLNLAPTPRSLSAAFVSAPVRQRHSKTPPSALPALITKARKKSKVKVHGRRLTPGGPGTWMEMCGLMSHPDRRANSGGCGGGGGGWAESAADHARWRKSQWCGLDLGGVGCSGKGGWRGVDHCSRQHDRCVGMTPRSAVSVCRCGLALEEEKGVGTRQLGST